MRRLLITLAAFLLLATPAHASWSWPVRGDVITPYRNGDNPYAAGQHRGIDIAAAVGTPVVAAAGFGILAFRRGGSRVDVALPDRFLARGGVDGAHT